MEDASFPSKIHEVMEEKFLCFFAKDIVKE